MNTYRCAYARNHRLLMNVDHASIDDAIAFIEYHAQRTYPNRVVTIEQYTDEFHVYVKRVNNNRRDFIASYQSM